MLTEFCQTQMFHARFCRIFTKTSNRMREKMDFRTEFRTTCCANEIARPVYVRQTNVRRLLFTRISFEIAEWDMNK